VTQLHPVPHSVQTPHAGLITHFAAMRTDDVHNMLLASFHAFGMAAVAASISNDPSLRAVCGFRDRPFSPIRARSETVD
jgi:hypothetical protein